MIAHRLVVSYTAFSPLLQRARYKEVREGAVIFFYLYPLSPTASIFRSGMSFAARTFLSHPNDASGRAGPLPFSLQI